MYCWEKFSFSVLAEFAAPAHDLFTQNEDASTERNVRNGKRKAVLCCVAPIITGQKAENKSSYGVHYT